MCDRDGIKPVKIQTALNLFALFIEPVWRKELGDDNVSVLNYDIFYW